MADDDRRRFVTFSVSAEDYRELRRLARRFAFPTIDPLAVEIFHVGLQQMEARFEPLSKLGQLRRLKEIVNAKAQRGSGPRRRRARGAANDPDHEGRRDRLPRRD